MDKQARAALAQLAIQLRSAHMARIHHAARDHEEVPDDDRPRPA